MSQSPVTVTYSLEEVLKQINDKLDKLDAKIDSKIDNLDAKFTAKIDKLQEDVNNFKTETKVSFESAKGDIKALDEKVSGLGKRLENQEFVNRGILIALVVAILGSAAKLLGWVGNP